MNNGPDILSNDNLGEPTNAIVNQLVEILGSRLCAVIGDVEQTSIVRSWIGGMEPTRGRARILRFALRVAEIIEGRCGSAAAQSFFQGANHSLADESPALVLRRVCCAGDVEALEAARRVAQALFEFLDE
jgi:hypothetical protein